MKSEVHLLGPGSCCLASGLLEITLEWCFEISGIILARALCLQSLQGVPSAQTAREETAAAPATPTLRPRVPLKNDAERLRVIPKLCVSYHLFSRDGCPDKGLCKGIKMLAGGFLSAWERTAQPLGQILLKSFPRLPSCLGHRHRTHHTETPKLQLLSGNLQPTVWDEVVKHPALRYKAGKILLLGVSGSS